MGSFRKSPIPTALFQCETSCYSAVAGNEESAAGAADHE
eukprot:COSAG01_NODE_39619_length_474_cov_0.941333_2_plen_38_part_01